MEVQDDAAKVILLEKAIIKQALMTKMPTNIYENLNNHDTLIDNLRIRCNKFEDTIKEQNQIIKKLMQEIKILKIKSKYLYLD